MPNPPLRQLWGLLLPSLALLPGFHMAFCLPSSSCGSESITTFSYKNFCYKHTNKAGMRKCPFSELQNATVHLAEHWSRIVAVYDRTHGSCKANLLTPPHWSYKTHESRVPPYLLLTLPRPVPSLPCVCPSRVPSAVPEGGSYSEVIRLSVHSLLSSWCQQGMSPWSSFLSLSFDQITR